VHFFCFALSEHLSSLVIMISYLMAAQDWFDCFYKVMNLSDSVGMETNDIPYKCQFLQLGASETM